jgi:uncharacterized protein YlxW (UPF0749 family)
MNNIEVYRTELENMNDEELFGETELAQLAETRMNLLVEEYEERLDDMDMGEQFRAAKIEERIEARRESLGHDGE